MRRLRARMAVMLCVLAACLPALARSASLCLCSGTVRVEARCCNVDPAPGSSCCSSSAESRCGGGRESDGDQDDGVPAEDDGSCCRDVSLEDAPLLPGEDRLDVFGADDTDSGAGAVLPEPPPAVHFPAFHAPATGPPIDHGTRRRLLQRAAVVLLI